VVLAGAAAAALGLLRALREGCRARAGLVLMVALALLVNAAVTGALSGPHPRYEARLAWLLPLAGLLAWAPGTPSGSGPSGGNGRRAPCPTTRPPSSSAAPWC
ncbi:MAG TPA: hypothetical protein VE684_07335, partial [Crenalkalicoccus sp.]|nr:hypothetical protein [Crenalkalicoccus sp.]